MITLQTLQGTGVVRVQSSPPGAKLIFDGEEYGSTPVTITNVDVGDHDYVLKLEGASDYTGVATINAGALCCVDVVMETGQETYKCTPAAQTPCPTENNGSIKIDAPGYIVISERTAVLILSAILIGIGIWIVSSRRKLNKNKTDELTQREE